MKKVLLIEDDSKIRDSLYQLLTHSGYKVETASDGQEGIDRLIRNKFYSTVITDSRTI